MNDCVSPVMFIKARRYRLMSKRIVLFLMHTNGCVYMYTCCTNDKQLFELRTDTHVCSVLCLVKFIRYTQHMYTYDMRRNKHTIQTYYRTRLFWLKNDNDKENK